MTGRRRQQQGLQRVLGAPALFATAYGNVGSGSIYYALGVTAALALGLTPLVFIVAGLIFAATAATYAEGRCGSRRPGLVELRPPRLQRGRQLRAAWAQMLNYIITIAISAFFVPHYLSIFWEPLKENPWDVIVGAA